MKRNVLWISCHAPYDGVRHAGGQVHNYYIKKSLKANNLGIELITFCDADQYDDVLKDHAKYNLKSVVIPWTKSGIYERVVRKIRSINSKYNPFARYCEVTNEEYFVKILQSIEKLSCKKPDIVILQWTQIGLFASRLKKIFPEAKFILIEEDVVYLSYYRKKNAQSGIKKVIADYKYQKIKRLELESLKCADLVILNNPKDECLVKSGGIERTWRWTPYFNNMLDLQREKISKDIVFFGAMSRPENHDSVMWFINNVFNKIKDENIRFVVVGNKPKKELIDTTSKRIIVTGFVESVRPYFQKSLCCVAPLVMGAGVKIKVLESLSAGIPVLTNDIGIEGIPASDGKEYIHCNTPEDYVNAIERLIANPEYGIELGEHAKEFIRKNYDYKKDADAFISKLEKM